MRLSEYFIPTLKAEPAEAELTSHKLMLKAGMIRKLAAGVYSLLPFGLKVIRNLEKIIREEMDKAGGQEVSLPCIQPASLWQETKRWDLYGKELFRLRDRHERSFCLGPTHEEIITDLVRKEVRSYRQLPLLLYQIQTKFRDEIRPRFGVMRGREFLMKDGYSFDRDEKMSEKTYRKMQKVYSSIFNRCALKFRVVEADSGQIGGNLSHEFMVLAAAGEDTIFTCPSCDYARGREKNPSPNHTSPARSEFVCPQCRKRLEASQGIEVGHTFKLGDKYSSLLKATYLDSEGREKFLQMGCYGIGIARTIAAAIEQNHDSAGIIWPVNLSPFKILVLVINVKDNPSFREAENIYNRLREQGIEVLIDQRPEQPGFKFKDADLLGIPFQIIVGSRDLKQNLVEIKIRKNNQRIKINKKEAANKLIEMLV